MHSCRQTEQIQLDPDNSNPVFWIPCYFELKIVPLGFALCSFTIAYFELPLFRTIFRIPCGFNCKCLIIHVIKVIFYQGSWWWRYHMTTPGWSLVLQTQIVWHRLTAQTGWTESAVLLQTILQCWYGWTHQSSPTLQSTKKQTKCGRTRYMVHAHATPEKFQNDVSTLKTHQMFFVPPTRRNLKTHQSAVILDLCLRETRERKHIVIITSSFSKSSVFKMLSIHT